MAPEIDPQQICEGANLPEERNREPPYSSFVRSVENAIYHRPARYDRQPEHSEFLPLNYFQRGYLYCSDVIDIDTLALQEKIEGRGKNIKRI